MNRKVPLNQWLYKALIDKEMDGFTVLELRNRLLYATVGVFNKNELRKMLYRQLYQLAERGYLEKRNNQANEKSRYFKTSAFKSVEFISAHRTNLPSAKTGLANSIQQPFIRYISQEKAQSEAELRILLGKLKNISVCLLIFLLSQLLLSRSMTNQKNTQLSYWEE